jgi:hypothetical protein
VPLQSRSGIRVPLATPPPVTSTHSESAQRPVAAAPSSSSERSCRYHCRRLADCFTQMLGNGIEAAPGVDFYGAGPLMRQDAMHALATVARGRLGGLTSSPRVYVRGSLVSAAAMAYAFRPRSCRVRVEAASRTDLDGECDWRCDLPHRRRPNRHRRAPARQSPIPYPARSPGGERVTPGGFSPIRILLSLTK